MDSSIPQANPFEVDQVVWQPVSPRLAAVRTSTLGIVFGSLTAIAAVVTVLVYHWALVLTTLALAGLGGWLIWVARRQAKAISYTLRGRDLWMRRGIMFRSLTILPYVRIQYVDVSSGPLERKYSLATLVVYTASPSVSATLPGLTPEAAQTLRDVLTDKKNLEPENQEPAQQVAEYAEPAQPITENAEPAQQATGTWETGPQEVVHLETGPQETDEHA
ncbi:MAG: PH domain-containing protein [Propionibacteriaceae bacterium]|jgi:membrane protein YdbS with pleckstrin-like domain|nr:PH domain-containing protein [Propionibacteriaceae bacterium]